MAFVVVTAGSDAEFRKMRSEAIASGLPQCWICGMTESQHPNAWHTAFKDKICLTGVQWTPDEIEEMKKVPPMSIRSTNVKCDCELNGEGSCSKCYDGPVTTLPPLTDEERYTALVDMEKQAHADDPKG